MEQIYTIPVNEAFEASAADAKCGCPLCALFAKLENDELDLILGASMMEPDVRIETNKKGFCKHHFDRLYENGNRLGLALVLESHLAEIEKKIFEGGTLFDGKGEKEQAKLEKLDSTCYVCDRMNDSLMKMFDNAIYLWETEEDFREKFKNQKYFCLPHYRTLLEFARVGLSKKDFSDFFKTAREIEKKYLSELENDISWFCKKFDYRYDNEPWYNAKDAIPRTLAYLTGGKNTRG
jgi:hypothetical protein